MAHRQPRRSGVHRARTASRGRLGVASGTRARAFAGVIGSAALVLIPAAAATADQGIAVSSDTRFDIAGKKPTVTGNIRLTLKNITPNRGNYIYYYNRFDYVIPKGATNLRATSGGSSLSTSVLPGNNTFTSLARVTFPTLYYGQSRTIDITFTVPGDPFRSKSISRVGPGYVTFGAFAVGDSGHASLTVTAPDSMNYDSTNLDLTSTPKGKIFTLTTTKNTEPQGIWAVISLRATTLSKGQKVSVDGRTFHVVSFPGDGKWTSFVTKELGTGIPILEKLTGTKCPGGLETIREDAGVSVRGYDGWFDTSAKEIVISERLDPELIMHELAHAWVSGRTLSQRWMSEGLAELIADRAVLAAKEKPDVTYDVSRTQKDALALNDWQPAARADKAENYAYPASAKVMTTLFKGLPDAKLASVVSAALRNESAYEKPTSTIQDHRAASWKTFLDLLETRGGVKDADAVFKTWVLSPADAKLLGPRETARAAYAKFDAANGPWEPPATLRSAMTMWTFESAERDLKTFAPLNEGVKAVQASADRTGMPVPKQLLDDYEKADLPAHVAALRAHLPAAAKALTDVSTATKDVAAERNPLASVGASVLGVDESATTAGKALANGDYTGASRFAEKATNDVNRSTLIGGAIIAGGLALIGLLVVAWRWSRRFTRRPAAPLPVSEA